MTVDDDAVCSLSRATWWVGLCITFALVVPSFVMVIILFTERDTTTGATLTAPPVIASTSSSSSQPISNPVLDPCRWQLSSDKTETIYECANSLRLRPKHSAGKNAAASSHLGGFIFSDPLSSIDSAGLEVRSSMNVSSVGLVLTDLHQDPKAPKDESPFVVQLNKSNRQYLVGIGTDQPKYGLDVAKRAFFRDSVMFSANSTFRGNMNVKSTVVKFSEKTKVIFDADCEFKGRVTFNTSTNHHESMKRNLSLILESIEKAEDRIDSVNATSALITNKLDFDLRQLKHQELNHGMRIEFIENTTFLLQNELLRASRSIMQMGTEIQQIKQKQNDLPVIDTGFDKRTASVFWTTRALHDVHQTIYISKRDNKNSWESPFPAFAVGLDESKYQTTRDTHQFDTVMMIYKMSNFSAHVEWYLEGDLNPPTENPYTVYLSLKMLPEVVNSQKAVLLDLDFKPLSVIRLQNGEVKNFAFTRRVSQFFDPIQKVVAFSFFADGLSSSDDSTLKLQINIKYNLL